MTTGVLSRFGQGGVLSSFLPKIQNFARNNSNALLGAAAGLSSGGAGNGWAGFAQGGQLDVQEAERRRLEEERRRQEQALSGALGGMDFDPQELDFLTAFPEFGAQTVANSFGPDATAAPDYPSSYDEYLLMQSDPGFAEYMQQADEPAQGLQPMTPDQRSQWGIPLEDARVWAIDPVTGTPSVIGGSPGSGMRLETRPDGSVVFAQGDVGSMGSGGTVTQQERQAAALYPGTQADFGIVTETFSALGDLGNQVGGALGVPGNFAVTPEYQRAYAALSNILQNFLVVTSGAAVTEPEFNRRLAQVLPRPGDDEATLRDKFARVQSWVAAIEGAAARVLSEGADGGAPSPASAPAAAGPVAPEGTIAQMPDGSYVIKQGGQWVPHAL